MDTSSSDSPAIGIAVEILAEDVFGESGGFLVIVVGVSSPEKDGSSR